MRAVLTIATAVLTVAYPLAVYYGLTRLGTRSVAILLAVLLVLGALLKAKTRAETASRERSALVGTAPRERSAFLREPREAVGLLVALGALALSGVLEDHRLLLITPVLINAGLFITFAGSLRTDTPLVERFARMQVSDLSAQELRYCRGVTQVWSAFFVLNGGIAALLALLAPLGWWALYNGFLAYVLIGLLGATEYVIRKRRFGRFGDNLIDRALQSVLRQGARG
jgi:uncharacterized membrane protein